MSVSFVIPKNRCKWKLPMSACGKFIFMYSCNKLSSSLTDVALISVLKLYLANNSSFITRFQTFFRNWDECFHNLCVTVMSCGSSNLVTVHTHFWCKEHSIDSLVTCPSRLRFFSQSLLSSRFAEKSWIGSFHPHFAIPLCSKVFTCWKVFTLKILCELWDGFRGILVSSPCGQVML